MAVMYSFCRYFSVRLGAILVAIATMIQSVILGGGLLWCLNEVEWTRMTIEDVVASYQLRYVTDLFISMKEYTKLYLQCAIVLLMLHIYACSLLIYGALKCNVPLVWPFLVVEFVRLGFLFFVHFTVMVFIKENFLDLGLLIVLCLSGGFILLGLSYMWFCVLSLCQCIRELNEDPIRQKRPGNMNLLASDFKHLAISSEGRFAVAPLSVPLTSPTYGLQPIPSLRHRDFHLGDLG